MKKKTVTNPMLVGAMALLKAENTLEHRKLVMEEITHATFLSPVIIDPLPEPDENGVTTVPKDSKIQLPMLSAPDGKRYYMAYTDMGELHKAKRDDNPQVFAFRFKDFVAMLNNPNAESEGVVINPFGDSLVIPRQLIESMTGSKNESTT